LVVEETIADFFEEPTKTPVLPVFHLPDVQVRPVAFAAAIKTAAANIPPPRAIFSRMIA
jgi:hypothetical protein